MSKKPGSPPVDLKLGEKIVSSSFERRDGGMRVGFKALDIAGCRQGDINGVIREPLNIVMLLDTSFLDWADDFVSGGYGSRGSCDIVSPEVSFICDAVGEAREDEAETQVGDGGSNENLGSVGAVVIIAPCP